jgi:hypothetical protein
MVDQSNNQTQRKLLIVALALLISVLFAGSLVFFIVTTMTNSVPYMIGIERVRANSDAISLLGKPISGDWYVMGRLSWDHANLRIPVKGPKADGWVYLKGQTTNGKWHFDYLSLKSNGKEINLLTAGD